MALMIGLLSMMFIPWAVYQWKRGEVYTNVGYTKFSPVEWIPREKSPFRFWGTILSQLAAGIILPSMMIIRFWALTSR